MPCSVFGLHCDRAVSELHFLKFLGLTLKRRTSPQILLIARIRRKMKEPLEPGKDAGWYASEISGVAQQPVVWVKPVHVLRCDKGMLNKNCRRKLFLRQQIQRNS